MPAANYDLWIEQGATFRFAMVFGFRDGTLDADGNPTMTPYDLTGCKVRMQIRRSRGSEVLVSATTSNGGIKVTDPVGGRIEVTITDEATDSLNVSRAKYDLEVGYPSGDVVRAIQGNVRVSPNITQDSDAANVAAPWTRDGIDEQDVDKDDLVEDQPSTF